MMHDTEKARLRLTNQQMVICGKLLDRYPECVPDADLALRVQYSIGGSPGEPIKCAAAAICEIRSLLGADSVETVYKTRTNAKGRVVRYGKSIGYRAGVALLNVVGRVPSSEVTSDGAGVVEPVQAGEVKLRGRGRGWQASESHRNDQARIMMQLEESCGKAMGL